MTLDFAHELDGRVIIRSCELPSTCFVSCFVTNIIFLGQFDRDLACIILGVTLGSNLDGPVGNSLVIRYSKEDGAGFDVKTIVIGCQDKLRRVSPSAMCWIGCTSAMKHILVPQLCDT